MKPIYSIINSKNSIPRKKLTLFRIQVKRRVYNKLNQPKILINPKQYPVNRKKKKQNKTKKVKMIKKRKK